MSEPAEVLRLAASGLELEAVGKRLDLSVEQVKAQLREAVRHSTEHGLEPEEERVVERVHLDQLRRVLLQMLLNDKDVAAARLLVRIHLARTALLGLAAPVDPMQFEPAEEVNELDRIRARRAERRGTAI